MEKKEFRKALPKMQTSMPLKNRKLMPKQKLPTLALRPTKKQEGLQRLKDLAVPTKAGMIRSILSDQKNKRKKKADEEWSRLRREKPSDGTGVGY